MRGGWPDATGMILLRLAAGARASLDDDVARLDAVGWHALANQAIAFRLPLLLAQVAAQRGWAVPEKTQAMLATEQRERALRALSQRHSLAQLAARANGLGMAPIVLKGGALMLTQGDDRQSIRTMRDLDLLLPEAEAHRLHAALMADGWAVPPGYARQTGADDHHLPVIADPQNGNLVELHTRLVKRVWHGDAGLQQAMRDGARAVSCLGEPVHVPSPTANLLHLLAHATLGRPFDPGPQFLADVIGLIGSGQVDPVALGKGAQALGLDRALALVMCLVDRLAGLPEEAWRALATPDAAPLVDSAMQALLNPQGRDRELRFAEAFAARGSSLSHAATLLRRALSPGAEALAALSGRDPQDGWRYLAYPRWIGLRMSAMAKAMFDPSIRHETQQAERLSGWLIGQDGGDGA